MARTSFSRIMIVAAIMLILSLAAIGGTLWQLRQDAISAALRDANNIATIMAEQATHAVQAVDIVLEDVVTRARPVPGEPQQAYRQRMTNAETHRFLVDRLSRVPQADVISITDVRGKLVSTTRSWPAPDVDVSDRDYFQYLKEHPRSSLFISVPVINRVTQQTTFYFAQGLEDASGAFVGIAMVGIRPEFFMRSYDVISSLPGESFVLLRKDGTVFLRYPDDNNRAGQKMPSSSEWHSVVARGGGHYRSPGVFDNEARWVIVKPLRAYPIVVDIAVSEKFALAEWRERASMIAIGAFIAVIVLALLLRLLAEKYMALRDSEAKLLEREAHLAAKTDELLMANIRFNAALNHMSQGLAMFDSQNRLVICNRRYAEMYGLGVEDVAPGTHVKSIVARRIGKGIYGGTSPDEYIRSRLVPVTGTISHTELLNDGRSILVSRQPITGGGWVTTHEDVSERQRATAQIAHMAHHDALTGLANRALFLQSVGDLAQGRTQPFAVMLIDLDEFKAVNDTYGHTAGDALLLSVSERLAGCVRDTDLVARLGGDEFAMVIPNAEASEIEQIAGRILEAIRVPHEVEGHHVHVGVSVGIAIAEPGDSPTDVMRAADLALYRAKSDGRNRYRLFEPEMEEQIQTQRMLAIDLLAAVEAEDLEVHYQPIVNIRTTEVCSMEALVRWRHPVRGMISPVIFIPIAEEAGLIHRIGQLVLRRACSQAVAWPDMVKISVNVSPLQLASGNLVAAVRAALDESGLPAKRLELEITESVLLRDDAHNIGMLHELRAMGVNIVLDDFGTGYSSLSYLSRFPLDKVKIDKSFTDRIGSNSSSSAIIAATTSIARELGATTTAEGVETWDQLELLRAVGVNQVQGYLFGRPLPAQEWFFDEARGEVHLERRGSRAA